LRRTLDRPVLFFLLVSAGVLAADALVVASGRLRLTPGLETFVVVVDYAVALPALYWYLVVRRAGARAATVLPVIALGLVAAGLVLPEAEAGGAGVLRWLLVGAELFLVSTALRRAAGAVRAARARSESTPVADFYDHLRDDLGRTFGVPAVGSAVAAEAALLYYAFTGWFRRSPAAVEAGTFSYHRASNMAAVVAALVGISAVEIPVAHILLANWSDAAAWIATALGIFGVVWGLGAYQSMRMRPTVVTADTLVLRLGVLAQARIPMRNVARVERARFPYPDPKAPDYLLMAPMGDPMWLITTSDPMVVERIYGRRRTARRVGVIVDRPEEFERTLREAMRA
jgi:hypothetical protein